MFLLYNSRMRGDHLYARRILENEFDEEPHIYIVTAAMVVTRGQYMNLNKLRMTQIYTLVTCLTSGELMELSAVGNPEYVNGE